MNKRIEKSDEQMHELSLDDAGHYSFSVVCGGIAMFEVTIRLSADEVAAYQRDGRAFLVRLARSVSNDTKAFEYRFV